MRKGRPTTTGGEPPRPPHIIRPDEVDAWLADSVNQRVTHHRTTRAAAQDILERGVDISRSRIAAYGQGFYTTTDVRELAGDVPHYLSQNFTIGAIGQLLPLRLKLRVEVENPIVRNRTLFSLEDWANIAKDAGFPINQGSVAVEGEPLEL